MKIIIKLIHNKGYKWLHNNNSFIKGYTRDENEILNFIETSDYNQIKVELVNLYGNYAFVKQTGNQLIAGVDKERSIPLFYTKMEDTFILSDSVYYIAKQIGETLFDKNAEYEFLLSGYVTGRDTLYSNIKQIQAGEILKLENSQLICESYFQFTYKKRFIEKKKTLLQRLDNIHEKIFKRVIKTLNNRTAVIPLSGGYDSRLIVDMLKRLNYKNVICFTYGKKTSWEVKISKSIADQLNYKWIFIEYTSKKWYKWYNSGIKDQYVKFASNFTSMSHFQDWAAVMELKNQNLIPKNSVFIPGHAADFLEGTHIPKVFQKNKSNIDISNVVNEVFKSHLSIWSTKQKDKIINKTKLLLNKGKNSLTNEEASELYENWVWRERQSKFIANSLRVYDFFGFKWLLPLWDNELIYFWQKVQFKDRVNRSLYLEYVNKYQNYSVEANIKQSKIKKIYEYFTDTWYGKIIGDKPLIFSLFKQTKSLFPYIKSFEVKSDFLFKEKKVGLHSIMELEELKKNTKL